MKVLFLVNNYPEENKPYAGVFVHNQVKAVCEKGIDAKVLYLDFRSIRRKRKWGMGKYIYDGIIVYRFAIPCGPLKKLYYWLINNLSCFAYKKVLKHEKNIDCIHAHFTDMGLAAKVIKEQFSVPYVLTEHSSTLIQKEISLEEETVIRQSYIGADRLLAVGSVLKSKMMNYTDKEITVVPNVLPERFRVYQKSSKEEKNFTFISVVGTLTKEKKIDLLVEAFKELYKTYTDIRLIICGAGNLMEELKAYVKDINLDSKIDFLGVINNNDLPVVLNNCDCFVLPSIVETFGVVYIEAAGCGLPLIGANSGGTADIINDDNGIIIRQPQVDCLVNAMEHMYNQHTLYNAELISRQAIENFGKDSFCEKIIKIYQEAI